MSSRPRRVGQQGYVILALMGVMLAGTLAMLSPRIDTMSRHQEWRTSRLSLQSLQQARHELLAYALMEDSTPGTLPCPATSEDASTGASCGAEAAASPGRLPFVRMGVSRLSGGQEECLWYMLSPSFRNRASTERAASKPHLQPINLDTPGQLVLHRPGSVAQRAIAIVIDPGRGPDAPAHFRSGCKAGTAAQFLEMQIRRIGDDWHIYPAASSDDRLLVLDNADVNAALLPYMLHNLGGLTSFAGTSTATLSLAQFRAAHADFDQRVFGASGQLLQCAQGEDKRPQTWLLCNGWYDVLRISIGAGHVRLMPASSSSRPACTLTLMPDSRSLNCQAGVQG